MRYLSLFSGIEAASVAWHPLGWECAGVAEVEKFPSAVLAHHFQNVPNLGDVTKYKEWPDAKFDVLVGGSPCQSFSVAGLRKGLADPRGNLMLTYLAIAGRYRPKWIVWENVPGVLSIDGGRAFGSFLGGLAELRYGFAYRVLDAQHFGVPQRRRRVFVVGYLGDWRRAAAVLFERESLSGDPAPRREARKDVAESLSARTRGGGGLGTDFEASGGVVEVSQTLRNHPRPGSNSVGNIVGTLAAAHWGQQEWESGFAIPVQTFCPEISPSLKARDSKGPSSDGDGDGDGAPLIAHSLRAGGFDASEDGTGRGTPLVPYTLAIRGRGDSHDLEYRQDGTANALLTPNGGRGGIGVGAVAFDLRNVTSVENRSNPQPGDPMHTLHNPADSVLTFGWNKSAAQTRMGHDGSHANGGGQVAVASAMQVRRITPREAERLQGFPDDFTAIPYGSGVRPEKLDADYIKYCQRGNPKKMTRADVAARAADGPRYKALGNSMAVPVMSWIGRRISEVEEQTA